MIIAAVLESPVIEKILTHLGLQAGCREEGKRRSKSLLSDSPLKVEMGTRSARHLGDWVGP